VAAAPVVANQGSDSQQSPGRSGSDRAESAIVGSDADLQSDEVGKFDADATRLVQVADAAQGLDTRNAPVSTNPVATSAPAPVSVDSSSPVTVAEPKAPAATPLPISTQMSAHLSAFRGLADGTYETTIRLNPEELGQVSVRIQVNGGTVSIHAFGANDIAVQRLREAMPDLRQDLLQSGLDLVDSQVDQGAASFGNQREAASRRRLDSDRTEVAADNRISRPTSVDAITDVLRSEGGRVDVRV
jgi:flagellar hook-length control protein FliK